MDLKISARKLDSITYNSDAYIEFKNNLPGYLEDSPYHLSLFLGLYLADKKTALEEIARVAKKEIERIDLNAIVLKSEEETINRLDELFELYKSPDSILYFENGSKLCGAYTGFTHSKVKYATPQERYFLEKVQAFGGLVIIDIPEYTDADQTIRRAAQSVISFPLPDSRLKRFLWHLKHYSLHGYDIKTKRPEIYGETPGNF